MRLSYQIQIALRSAFLHDFGMELHSHGRTLRIKQKTGIIGVINVTPDSFIAGSRAETPDQLLARARECLEGGADILEIGGESTGPGSVFVSEQEELSRVLPAVTQLRKNFPQAWIVVDTWKAPVAHAALDAGADLINDVTAGRGDETMFDVLREAGCPVILMYAKDPSARTTSAPTQYDDVVATVSAFLAERIAAAKKAGVSQVIVDPGLGHFVSSDPAYSWQLLTRLDECRSLGPILVSPARKSFLAGPSKLPPSERLHATLAASGLAAVRGASLIRTHDVRQTRRVLDALQSIHSLPT